MSPAGRQLWAVFRAAERRVRRDAFVALAAALAAFIPCALVLAWLLGGGAAWLAPSPVPLLLELAVVMSGTAAGVWIWRRWVAPVGERTLAAAAESAQGLPDGSVSGVLELGRELPLGTSPALFRLAEASLAQRLAGANEEQLGGAVFENTRRRRRRALVACGALTGAAVALGFVSPERTRAGWAPLLHPVAHLAPPPLPALVVTPGDAEVARGGTLEVRVQAPGRAQVVVRWRAAGDVPRQRSLEVEDEYASTRLGPVDAPLEYWVSAPDGASSARYRVTPLDPLLFSDLVVDVVYPSYLGQPAERFEGEVPPLEIPLGTELRVRGRATQRLRAVALRPEGAAGVALEVTGDRFAGRWVPRASGTYAWQLVGHDGGAPAVTPAPLELTIVTDSAPTVEITFPGMDTLFGAEMQQPLVANARDDHGLRAASVVSWRVSALGDRDAPIEQPIPLEGAPDRIALRALLDGGDRRLLPGDTLYYFMRVVDTSPARQAGVSRTYRLRLPSMSELRREARAKAEALLRDASQIARSAAELAQSTRDLRRRSAGANAARRTDRSRADGQPGEPGSRRNNNLDFREAERARQVLESQEAMLRRVEELRERAEALERALTEAGLKDPELQQRLQELRQLYDQMLTPELREKLEQLRKSLEELDPEKVQQALEQLAKQQEEFKQRLEQSLELLRRAAAEQQMNELAREAQELATQQQALAEEMKREGMPTEERAQQQAQLAERTDSLQQRIEQLQQQLAEQGETQAAEQSAQAAQQAQQAAEQAQQAAQQASQGAQQAQQAQQSGDQGQQQSAQQQGQQAAQQGEQAASNLEQAARTLESARRAMAEAWKQETQQAVQQATKEALALAQRQNSLAQKMQQAQQQGQQSGSEMQGMRGEQAALQQGLQALGKNLSEAGQRTAHINRDVGAALGRAMLSMQQTLDALEGKDGNRRLPVPEATQTVDALNRLALALLANSQQIQQAQSGTGLQEALEQLAELAKQQGGVNGQTNSLLPLELGPRALGEQLQRLAREQRDIAQKLGGLNDMVGGREDVLGRLDAMAREAEQLARELSGGRLTPEMLARQERLFHRLLDAGRTLEREETSDERVAERPGDVAPSQAGPLDARLLDGGLRYPAPTPEQLRSLPPAYRRLILDYFERLNRGAEAATRARKDNP